MKSIEKTVLINAPVEKLFNYIANPMTHPEWLPSLLEVKELEIKKEGIDTYFRLAYKVAGMKLNAESTCIAFIPNKKIIVQSKGRIKSTWEWSFEG